MGNDPKKSVVNQFQQSHDVKNLFVVDGSTHVSASCQNPTWTIMALAWSPAIISLSKCARERYNVLERRDLLKLSLGAALASGATKHKFFTDEEYALVDELTDIIIPTDEKSGGARAAKVADYIDQVLAEAFDSEKRYEWRIRYRSSILNRQKCTAARS